MPDIWKFEVILADVSAKSPRNEWSMFIIADSFGDAEDEAKNIVLDNKDNSEIIRITKEVD